MNFLLYRVQFQHGASGTYAPGAGNPQLRAGVDGNVADLLHLSKIDHPRLSG